MKARNPYTGQIDYEFPPTSPGELGTTCTRLREAQPGWQRRGLEGRAKVLRKFAAAVARHRDTLIEAIVGDTGRHGISVREAALEPVIEREIAAAFKFAREEMLGDTELPDVVNRRQLASYALVGNITPWNFPCSMAFLDTIPALVAGCAVVVKPSEVTPRFIDVVERILADVPELAAVLSFVRGDGSLGAELISQALNAGGVSVNRAGITLMVRGIEQDAWNASGLGKNRMGREGIRRFARSKAIMPYGGSEEGVAPDMARQVFTRR